MSLKKNMGRSLRLKGHGCPQQGGKTVIRPPFRNCYWEPKFSSKPEIRSFIPILILALTVYFPVWHPQCTRTRFTVLLLRSDEFAVHSCPLLCGRCLQRQVAKLLCWLFYWWTLLRNNDMVTNLHVFTSCYGSRRFSTCDCECWTQEMQGDSATADSHVCHSLLCKKKHAWKIHC